MRAVLRLATVLPLELLYRVTQGGLCSVYLSSSSKSFSGMSEAATWKDPSFLIILGFYYCCVCTGAGVSTFLGSGELMGVGAGEVT